MTVRAVLARPRGADPSKFEGVYLHNAGLLPELGPVLWTLMRDRYNFDAAGFSREMIDMNLAGWSNIDCLGGPLAKTWDGKTKISVEQHQENFNADREDAGPTTFQSDPTREIPGITAPPIDDTSDNWGADIVYVVGSDALHILVPDGSSGPYEWLGAVPWGDEPDWDEIQEAMNDALENLVETSDAGAYDDDAAEGDGDDNSADDGDDEVYLDYDACETSESLTAVAESFAKVQRGDLAGAQAGLLKYLADTGHKSPKVLTNLFFTLRTQPIAAARLTALFDETLAEMAKDDEVITPDLVGNMCIVLNNHGRGADSVRAFELALEREKWPHTACYVGMTYGAFVSDDLALVQRAVEHVERAMTKKPRLLVKDPTVFDNTAALYLKLGNKAKTLEYVRLCKEHGYRNFAEMPAMPDYAALEGDAEFEDLFR